MKGLLKQFLSVYHYTDNYQKLINILKDKRLQVFSNCHSLNMKWYWEIIQIVFSKMIPQLPKSIHSCCEPEDEYRSHTQGIGIRAIKELRISDEIIFQGEEGYLSLHRTIFYTTYIGSVGVCGNLRRQKPGYKMI